jgi:hypothetical protein
LVLALHLVFIAILLHATVTPTPAILPARESILWFVLPHRATPAPARPREPGIVRRARPAAPPNRDYRAITLPWQNRSAPPGDLHSLLFNCAPENLAGLSPEQRMQCAQSPLVPKQNDSVDYADHTDRSHNAARWAREKQRKNGPLLLPCASPQSILGLASLGGALCVAHGLAKGFDTDNLPLYGDRPEDVHVPNNGDPPDRPPN